MEHTDMAGFAHPEFLVGTEWLAGHLHDPDVLVFDCTTHLVPDPKITYQVVPGREDFAKGHIPGAQFVDMLRDVSDTSHRFRFMRPAPEAFAAAMIASIRK
jgi:thiosulfate/3-mercaptopyruvate sulfurtransferase